ncbi:MAG: 3-deoxy-manno-octulosonate cytidylyltransferase [Phycisphaerae bacterium]|nr:3-deoxy-manno-octulosonate cytidylyltransferase [Phycisphaerae bacterium]
MSGAAGSSSKHANAVAIIPARYGSTRFPAKPLARDTGKFLIQHVYEQVVKARRISSVIVATDDRRILDAVTGFGGRAVMTRADHPSGTDRLAEVAAGLTDELIVNVQGDEPEIDPGDLDVLVSLIAGTPGDCPMATLACPYPAGESPANPNLVKVIVDNAGRAIYFSRAAIPFVRDAGANPLSPTLPPGGGGVYLLHRGLYAYRRDFLLKFAKLAPGRLEQLEKLEQLRALEHGYDIAVAVVGSGPAGIDTPEQYAQFVERRSRGE